ncbi:hypothetical protein CO015_02050 [candidate division WWE3 bacterium CG_4_8_14_3_um_filter_42_11]|uniref:Antitoxin n=3 Tax=Katanobacteria TaxID=422282 RepID=A0A2M7TD70_UNCKA|nr:MAG: hypothetical protein COY34_00975 [candidate division WWE3 bacterium CG_4_10_14_0_2_um_filter_42_8]PJA37439.1 MAG: hypothetical protein CO181_03510 [candidate division WWE3 bacterium CG_4_9_14_3_um_filter_43_9]PJC68981.1 MAG: hypothetical protein CO015_02050 [candidate division WWE3 bacterium CG_4_8_14_3_um_filter_42_11]
MKTTDEEQKFQLKKEYDFSKGIRGRFYQPRKIQKTLRLDDDIILYFQRLAVIRKVGYQTLINETLRKITNHSLENL